MKLTYISRKKEPVRYVWHTTALDGTVTHGDGVTCREWIYTRPDGTEFVNLNEQRPVRRVNGVAVVDKTAKVGVSYSVTEMLQRHKIED